MNVLIVGATGFVGTAVDEALSAKGHRVSGVARSDSAQERLKARGTGVVLADAAKPSTLEHAVADFDAVVYAVNVTDADPWTVNSKALRAIRKGLGGTEKTFVYVSSAFVYGSGGETPMEETATFSPPSFESQRVELERATLEMTRIGVRALIVRGGIAYGKSGGIPAMFVQSARERGAATILGDGKNRWATIGIDDLGRCIGRAAESGQPGRAYNAVNDDRFTVLEIAEAGSRGAGAGGATKLVAPEIMGHLGECLALDQIVSAERAKATFGWSATGPSIKNELEFGSYVASLA